MRKEQISKTLFCYFAFLSQTTNRASVSTRTGNSGVWIRSKFCRINQISILEVGDWNAMYRHVTNLRERALISRTTTTTDKKSLGISQTHVRDSRFRNPSTRITMDFAALRCRLDSKAADTDGTLYIFCRTWIRRNLNVKRGY